MLGFAAKPELLGKAAPPPSQPFAALPSHFAPSRSATAAVPPRASQGPHFAPLSLAEKRQPATLPRSSLEGGGFPSEKAAGNPEPGIPPSKEPLERVVGFSPTCVYLERGNGLRSPPPPPAPSLWAQNWWGLPAGLFPLSGYRKKQNRN